VWRQTAGGPARPAAPLSRQRAVLRPGAAVREVEGLAVDRAAGSAHKAAQIKQGAAHVLKQIVENIIKKRFPIFPG